MLNLEQFCWIIEVKILDKHDFCRVLKFPRFSLHLAWEKRAVT